MILEEELREEYVSIPPRDLHGRVMNEAFLVLSRQKLGVLDRKTNFVDCALKDFEILGPGKVFPSNPFVYQQVRYRCVRYRWEIGDLVRVQVINVTRDGAFATDGLFEFFIHRSQLSKEFVEYDPESSEYRARDNRTAIIRIGSIVLGRLVSISFSPVEQQNHMSLTLRQDGLRVLHL